MKRKHCKFCGQFVSQKSGFICSCILFLKKCIEIIVEPNDKIAKQKLRRLSRKTS